MTETAAAARNQAPGPSTDRASGGVRMAITVLGSVLPALLLMVFLSAALAVSGFRLVQNMMIGGGAWVVVASLLYAALLGLGLWLAGQRRFLVSDGTFAAVVCGAALLLRLLALLWRSGYVQMGDHAQLRDFVLRLAASGLTPENLSSLSHLYDYPVWLSRAFPIYLPLRWAFGQHDLLAVQLANALLSTGCVLLTLMIGRMLFRPPVHRFAAVLMALFPLHILEVLSYTVQIPGTLLFILAVYLALGWVRGEALSVPALAARGMVSGALMFLLRIQRGLDLLLLPFLAALAIVAWTSYSRRSAVRLTIILLFSLLVYLPAASKHGEWMGRFDVHRIRSHVLGFMSRGWNPVTLGEYYDRFEQIDVATPVSEKRGVLLGIVVSQVVRDPSYTLGVMPVVKVAKFFLVGYAGSIEQGLEAGGEARLADVYRALRLLFAPVFLSLAGLGCWRWYRSGLRTGLAVLMVWLPILACLSTTVLWETSPRYSHMVHFAIALLAAVALTPKPWDEETSRPARVPTGTGFVVFSVLGGVVIYLAGALAVFGGAKLFGDRYLLEDMRGAELDAQGGDAGARETGREERRLSHLEQWLVLPAGQVGTNTWTAGRLPLSLAGETRGRIAFYLFGEPAADEDLRRYECVVQVSGQVPRRVSCTDLKRMMRLEFPMEAAPDGRASVRVRLQAVPGFAPPAPPGAVTVRWGYVRLYLEPPG